MELGRFKVFDTCTLWLEESRMYHRKNGVIVDARNHLLDATRQAMMCLDSAIVTGEKPRARYTFRDKGRGYRSSELRGM
jgi:hypothetical protein